MHAQWKKIFINYIGFKVTVKESTKHDSVGFTQNFHRRDSMRNFTVRQVVEGITLGTESPHISDPSKASVDLNAERCAPSHS
jgi:hypothetical protein